MCCNFSKNAPPQYHPFASTWSSKNIEIPVQRILLGIIAADLGLNVFGGDATNSYVHSSEPDQSYLSIDKANSDWSSQQLVKILIIINCLQGHPES